MNIYIGCTSIFFVLFSYLVLLSLWYNYLFLYYFLPIHSKMSIDALDKCMFEFLEALIYLAFQKKQPLRIFVATSQ